MNWSRSDRGERARTAAISHSDRKSDQVDAEKLARYARLDPKILRPIAHRTVAQQEALTVIRARNLIVRLRTAAVNAVRGLAKPCGYRLMAQPFDLRSLRMSGEAEPVAEGVERFLDLVTVGAFTASNSGLLAYQTGPADARKQLTWFDRTGKRIKTLRDSRAFFSIELSPDGRTLAASTPDALGNYDLWLYDVASGLPTRFTSDPGGEFYGVWSPDGRSSIMFPTIFSLGEAELGPLSGVGSGLLNMAIVGGAILPVIQGVIADHVGIHHAFVLPVICYLYILFYALNGSKPNSVPLSKA